MKLPSEPQTEDKQIKDAKEDQTLELKNKNMITKSNAETNIHWNPKYSTDCSKSSKSFLDQVNSRFNN